MSTASPSVKTVKVLDPAEKVLSDIFSRLSVNEKDLEAVDCVFKDLSMAKGQEKMVVDSEMGISADRLESFASELVQKFKFLDDDDQKDLENKIKNMAHSTQNKSSHEQVSYTLDELKYVYGFLASVKDSNTETISVAHCICSLEFNKIIRKETKWTKLKNWSPLGKNKRLTGDQIEKIKSAWCLNHFLKKAQASGLLDQIRYVK